MVDRPRCSGEILSRSVVDDIRTAAAAIVERAGAAGGDRETSPAYSVRRVAGIPDRGRGGNNKKEQRNESGPKFINGRQAVGRYASGLPVRQGGMETKAF